MKSNYILLMLAFGGAFFCSSCSDDDSEEKYIEESINLRSSSITYNPTGIWDGTYEPVNLSIAPFTLSHEGTKSAWGDYFTGFTASRLTGNSPASEISRSQFNVMAGKGCYTSGDTNPYLVAYWNSMENDETPWADRSCLLTRADASGFTTFTLESVDICNSVYTYYAMVDGTAFSSKFKEGDYLKVIAHGMKADGSVNTLEFYLARCSGSPENWYVHTWSTWSLYALGEVEAVWFTMESSDSGQWGMNTPGYFCIGDIKVKYQIAK